MLLKVHLDELNRMPGANVPDDVKGLTDSCRQLVSEREAVLRELAELEQKKLRIKISSSDGDTDSQHRQNGSGVGRS